VRLSCVTCADEPDPGQVAWATVHSSEREFEHERFAVWRCPRCRCIHAFGDVDLDRYYRRYGLHETGLDLLERVFYRNKLRFIRRFVPLDRGGPVLDFGCGNGVFVEYLRRRGYTDVAGYDPYSAAHADPGVLGRRYRLVLSTDGEQVAPGGFLYLQTPDAHHIDLERAATVRQVLKQPYHRHLVTTAWLEAELSQLGFEPVARTHRPISIPGSRSSSCRRSTGTWTGTAGWSPSTSRSAGRRCCGRASGTGGSPAGSSPGPTRSSSSSGVPAEAGPAGTAERRRTAGWSAVRYRQERCT
jgi:hypothetical protein